MLVSISPKNAGVSTCTINTNAVESIEYSGSNQYVLRMMSGKEYIISMTDVSMIKNSF